MSSTAKSTVRDTDLDIHLRSLAILRERVNCVSIELHERIDGLRAKASPLLECDTPSCDRNPHQVVEETLPEGAPTDLRSTSPLGLDFERKVQAINGELNQLEVALDRILELRDRLQI